MPNLNALVAIKQDFVSRRGPKTQRVTGLNR
jgi:hypothetical protein